MSEPLKIIPNADLTAGPPTPGMARSEAFATDELWVGEVHTDPGTVSGWHHHGEHATYGRVLEGSVHVEFGPGGSETLDGQAGDFFFVPPHTVHREGNPGTTEQLLVVVRVGSGQTVFPVDGPDPE